ncbi:DUF4291 family protein [Okeania sp. SIO2B3]|uniref:DUF4291 family protein n=1 Tax=Okeania sp. SIO2B3 TaxID=2607784 RepID=UPI0035C88C3E
MAGAKKQKVSNSGARESRAVTQVQRREDVNPTIYKTQEEWKEVVKRSSVRVQWDSDHNPMGEKLERRAIQLGLRGEALRNYSRDWIVKIENITEFVQQQRIYREPSKWTDLITPKENVYPVENSEIIHKLGLSIRD